MSFDLILTRCWILHPNIGFYLEYSIVLFYFYIINLFFKRNHLKLLTLRETANLGAESALEQYMLVVNSLVVMLW